MALIKCSECGKDISSEAKACPHCGAKPQYKPSAVFVIVVVALAAIVIKAAIETSTPPISHEKSAAEIASDWRHQMGGAAISLLKKRLREPDSLDVISLYTNEAATTVCLKYRARNGFGGYSVEYWIVTESAQSDSISDWNKHCTSVSIRARP